MLTDIVLSSMKRSILCWLATVDAQGFPNVSPKEIFCANGIDTLLIANIASPNSAANINANGAVCVSFVDPFLQKGFKCKGTARVVTRHDADFAALSTPLSALAGPRFPFAALFAIQLTSIESIIAPSYRLYKETTEAEQIASAMTAYGVRPLTS